MNRATKLVILSLSAAILSYVAVGRALGKTSEDRTYRSLGVFSEVLQRVQQEYVDDPNMQVVTLGALHGLLESLDPQSSYLSPREYDDFKKRSEKPERGDVGLVLSKRFGYIVVLATLPDSPAQKVGLRSGDLLESLAGFTTREMSIKQAQLFLAGEPGTGVKMSEVRRGRTEPQEVDVVRAVIPPPKLLADRLEADVAYMRVPTFGAGRAAEIREKLSDFGRQGQHKLILDLRDCASGDASEAIETAKLFLPSGTITTLRGQSVTAQESTADSTKRVWSGPVSVLISNSTAGPAEILAAALVDNKRAEAVGERTFGSASEQKIMPLEDGGALVLTVALYYSPGGKSISSDGVTPAVEVHNAPEDAADLDVETPATPSGEVPKSHEDLVLKKALEILKGESRKSSQILHRASFFARALDS
jgi:carboxyl-terminal processing protease